MIDGILVINKPTNMTSHTAVAWVRRILDTRRVGHAGTLDPDATGVLVVCVGRATRLMEHLLNADKEYLAEATFGVVTNSQDASGEVLDERDGSALMESDLRGILPEFTGEIRQIPPMVSAIQIGGERLYKKALRGEEVVREPRPVTIHSLDLLDFRPGTHPVARLRVVCSKGTYVRTLCHDLGQRLGAGAMLSALKRTRVGAFRLEDSIPLEELERLGLAALRPMVDGVPHLPQVRLTELEAATLIHGGTIPANDDLPLGESVRLMLSDTELIGVGLIEDRDGAHVVRPDKIVAPREDTYGPNTRR